MAEPEQGRQYAFAGLLAEQYPGGLRRGVEQVAQQRLGPGQGEVHHHHVGRRLAQHLARFLVPGIGQHLPVVAPGEQGIGHGAGTVGIGSGEEDAHGGQGLRRLTNPSGCVARISALRHALPRGPVRWITLRAAKPCRAHGGPC